MNDLYSWLSACEIIHHFPLQLIANLTVLWKHQSIGKTLNIHHMSHPFFTACTCFLLHTCCTYPKADSSSTEWPWSQAVCRIKGSHQCYQEDKSEGVLSHASVISLYMSQSGNGMFIYSLSCAIFHLTKNNIPCWLQSCMTLHTTNLEPVNIQVLLAATLLIGCLWASRSPALKNIRHFNTSWTIWHLYIPIFEQVSGFHSFRNPPLHPLTSKGIIGELKVAKELMVLPCEWAPSTAWRKD